MRSSAYDLSGPGAQGSWHGASPAPFVEARARSRQWPIRNWLILLVLATIAPLAAYGLLSTVHSYQAERLERVDQTVALSKELGRSTERLLEQQLVGLETLAGDPSLSRGDYDHFTSLASHYLSAIAPHSRLTVTDASGAVRFSIGSPGTAAEPPEPQSLLALHKRVFAKAGPEIALVPAEDPKEWLVAVAVPVLQGNDIIADLTLDLPVSTVQALLEAQHIPAGWTAIIVDQSGRIVAHVPPAPALVGKTHTADVTEFLHSGKQTETVDIPLQNGTRVVGALSRTPRFGWVTGVAIPRGLMLAPLRVTLLHLVTVGVVALALSLVFALLVARRLSRPITALAHMAARFDRSDTIPPAPPPSLREADEVARVLEMSMRRRRDAEDAAKDAEMRASRVIEDAPCGVILFGADGAWRLVNQATCDLLGRSSDELLGFTIRSPDLDVRDRNGDPIPIEKRASARALRGDTVRGVEVSMLRGDGRRAHMLFNSAPLRDRQGRITGALTALLDISDRLAAEERLEGLLQTLESRVEDEVAAREAAQLAAAQAQKMQALGQLAGGVAHDFNNVLQAISGAVSLIESRAGQPDQVRRFARTAASAAERGAAVAGRLLAFARRSDLVSVPIEAQALLLDVREILAHTLGGDVTVRTEFDPEVGWLLADRAQIETALVNLATNARDAMPEGGALTLRGRREHVSGGPAGLRAGDYVRLDVEDTGTGMDAAILARATEPFFTTKPLDKGTGLGLAMVRGVAEQLNGGLAIRSRIGEGTTVSIWLPATTPPSDSTEPATSASHHAPQGLRLLLVDDEPAVRSVLAEELCERGWVIEQASCAQEALELLREACFDVMIADQSMPGESGIVLIGFARRLRPGLPAILLTGLAPEIGDELTGTPEDAAITEVAGKPIRARELARRVERLLVRARAAVAE